MRTIDGVRIGVEVVGCLGWLAFLWFLAVLAWRVHLALCAALEAGEEDDWWKGDKAS